MMDDPFRPRFSLSRVYENHHQPLDWIANDLFCMIAAVTINLNTRAQTSAPTDPVAHIA
jgi:hypothetical protein